MAAVGAEQGVGFTYAIGKLRLAAGKSGMNGAGIPIPQRRTLLKTVTFRFFELSTVAPIIILFHSTNSSSSLLGFPFQ